MLRYSYNPNQKHQNLEENVFKTHLLQSFLETYMVRRPAHRRPPWASLYVFLVYYHFQEKDILSVFKVLTKV